MKKFKPNANYFERKAGTLEDIVSKINEASPKPEVFDLRNESEEYKKVFNAAMKKFKINSPADLKGEEEKKKFFNYVDSQYTAKDEQMDDKAQMANQSRKNKDGEKVKMSVKETVRDMLLKSWKQAAQIAEDAKEKKEALDKEDEKTVKDVIKGLKKASDTHAGQAKQLKKDISDSYHDMKKEMMAKMDDMKAMNDPKKMNMMSMKMMKDMYKMPEMMKKEMMKKMEMMYAQAKMPMPLPMKAAYMQSGYMKASYGKKK